MSRDPVLFVEDDAISSLMHCTHLRARGFKVISAYSAAAAYALMDRHPRLAALVTDFDLGAGDNGLDIARRARAIDQGVPVVFISGNANLQSQTDLVRGSVLLAKPLYSEQIVDALLATTGLAAA